MSARDDTDWMNVGGIGVGARAEEMRDERIVAVWMDSLPPFSIAALPTCQPIFKMLVLSLGWRDEVSTEGRGDIPDLIANAAMLTTTSGLASKMTNKTPIGQVTLCSSNPGPNSFANVT
jgi:hypothetical protein